MQTLVTGSQQELVKARSPRKGYLGEMLLGVVVSLALVAVTIYAMLTADSKVIKNPAFGVEVKSFLIGNSYEAAGDNLTETSVFSPTDKINYVVKVSNNQVGAQVKVVLNRFQANVSKIELSQAEKTLAANENTLFSGNFSNAGGYESGSYELDLYVNDRLERSVKFQVR